MASSAKLLYDNLKSAVLERVESTCGTTRGSWSFVGITTSRPPCTVSRKREGKVERAIQYLRHSFFDAREYRDLDDLNEQLFSVGSRDRAPAARAGRSPATTRRRCSDPRA